MPQSDAIPDSACPTQNALTQVAEFGAPIPGRGVANIYRTPRARMPAGRPGRRIRTVSSKRTTPDGSSKAGAGGALLVPQRGMSQTVLELS